MDIESEKYVSKIKPQLVKQYMETTKNSSYEPDTQDLHYWVQEQDRTLAFDERAIIVDAIKVELRKNGKEFRNKLN